MNNIKQNRRDHFLILGIKPFPSEYYFQKKYSEIHDALEFPEEKTTFEIPKQNQIRILFPHL